MPIVDAGIKIDPTDPTFKKGTDLGIWIKNEKGGDLVGNVWPGNVHFPDFLNNKTSDWWVENLSEFQKLVEFNGIWIDMNEASNFCDGECGVPNTHTYPA